MVSIPVVQKQLQDFVKKGDEFIKSSKKESDHWEHLLKIEHETEKNLKDIKAELPADVKNVLQGALVALIGLKGKKGTDQAEAVVVALNAIKQLQEVLGEDHSKNKFKVEKPSAGAGA